MTNVLIISNNKKAVEAKLEELLGESGFSPYVFHPDNKLDLLAYKATIIVEPYIINKEYYSILTVWKRYLAEKAKDTKLLVVGFKRCDHPNYVNLLGLQPDFDWREKINEALPTTNDWPMLNDLKNGADVLDKFSMFFVGHNHESIIDCITYVRATLNNANIALFGSKILKKEKQNFKTIWETILVPGRTKLREFYSRWQNYKGFFEIMPFNTQLERIGAEAFVDQLNDLFSGRTELNEEKLKEKEGLYKALNSFSRIGDLTKTLQNINKKYVSPELIADVLLIDDDRDFHGQMMRNFSGFHFYNVYNTEDAKSVLPIRDFNLILLDLQLSGKGGNLMEGVDLIPVIKELRPDIPLVIVSTHSKPSVIRRSLRNGADYYLVKSTFDVENWIGFFLKLLGNQRFQEHEIIEFNTLLNGQEVPQVLIIDDEKEWFDRVSELSRELNYTWASTIQQADDILATEAEKYDLLILDLYYKEGDGEEQDKGSQFLRDTKLENPDLPVIVMTRSNQDKDQAIAFGKGADFYLPKAQFSSQNWLKSIKLLVETKKLKEKLNQG